MASRRLELVFTGDTDSLERAFRKVDRSARDGGQSVSRYSKGLGVLKTGALAAGAALGAGLAASIRTGIDELREQEAASARTGNVLKTTGGAAGVTAKHVEDLAGKLQGLTGSQDDVIQSGANVLLTFTRIGAKGGVFDRALAITNDLSVALGKDMEGSARQVGRALNDPVKGLGALTRAGVQFTDKQKDQIKRLAESGKLMQAQQIVLRQLEQRFKGAASAEGEINETTQRLQRQWEDMSETVVGKAIPALTKIISVGNRIEAALASMRAAVRNFARTLANAVGDAVEAVVAAVGRMVSAVRSSVSRFLAAARAIGAAIVNGIRGGLSNAVGAVRGGVMAGLNALRGLAGAALARTRAIGTAIVDGIVSGIRSAAGRIGQAVLDAIPNDITPGFDFPGLSRGGGPLPGRPGQPVPIIAHAGEVVLNRRQQSLLGPTRILDVLRRTGGIIGGRRSQMQAGGYVQPFPGGSWAGGPSAHAGRALGNWQSDNAWDIMGSGNVYALGDGTIGRVSNYMDPRGQFAGGYVYLSANGAQWFYKHIKPVVRAGQRVRAGDLIGSPVSWTNGGPHLHLGTDRGNFSAARAGASPGSVGSGPGRSVAGPRSPEDLMKSLGLNASQLRGARAIVRAFRKYGLDPSTGIAVALTESGLNPGAIGDGGTSFGLFQLHIGGVLGNISVEEARKYLDPDMNADRAARGIKGLGIGNLEGADAVRAITTRFERPANAGARAEVDVGNLPRAQRIVGALSGGTVGGGGGGGSTGAVAAQPRQETPLQSLTRTLGRVGVFGRGVGDVARRILGAGNVGSFSDSFAGSSLSSPEGRQVTAAGRRARIEARKAGLSPDEVSARGQEAERQSQAKFLKEHISKIDGGLRKLAKQRNKLQGDLDKLLKSGRGTPGQKKAVAKRIRTALAQVKAEMDELLDLRAEANGALNDLNEEAAAEAYDTAFSAAGGAAGAEGEAADAPTQADYLNANAAEAALTPGLDDDLAAAVALEQLAAGDLNAARAGGDPRAIAAAAQAYLQAKQQREALEAQIKALKENTDALNALNQTFGGSNVVGYRGQDFIIRSLVPPSSDRLTGAEVGI